MRILIMHTKGANIAYLYHREEFELLRSDKDDYDNSQFVKIGSKLECEGINYIVESLVFRMFEEPAENNNSSGVNLLSSSELADYNCQLVILVKRLD